MSQSNDLKDKWAQGINSEISFWDKWVEEQGQSYSEDEFNFRMSDDTELQNEFKELIDSEPSSIKILDVGSGPVSVLGKKWNGEQLDITAIDPLADDYTKILDKFNLTPPVRIEKGEGENLHQLFPDNHFDFIHTRNSLDHCWSPSKTIENIIRLLKPSCKAYLCMFTDEAVHENYEGLHQWNFNEEDGQIIMWNKTEKIFLKDISNNFSYRYSIYKDTRWIEIVITKDSQ